MNQSNIELEEIESELEDLDEDTAQYKITTYGADYTLALLSSMYEQGEISIPDFQRRYVWPVKKASKLIESFLLGLPVPQIFLFREVETQNLLVVDGQQRLLTAHFFFSERLEDGSTFRLKGVKGKWEGKTFPELEEADRRKLKNSILRTTIFEQQDPQDNTSVFEIFERLNTGGVALNQQEIRNCVIRGNIKDFFNEINNFKPWRALLNSEQPDKRMKDVEMVLRFFALLEGWGSYRGPMKDFMSNYMRKYQNLSEASMQEMRTTFEQTMSSIYTSADTGAFKLKGGINLAVFDSVAIAVTLRGAGNIPDMDRKIQLLKTNEAYVNYVSKATTNEDSVTGRIKIALEIFS